MAERTMGPVDTIWLNMDSPENLMIIDSLVVFDGPVDWHRVESLIRRRFIEAYPVFAQRAVDPRLPIGSPHWEDDPDFDLGNHIIRATLTGDDDVSLQRYIEEWTSVPFDRARPLWQIHFIDGFRHGAAMYFRVHHCIADGMALNKVMLSMTGDGPDSDLTDDAIAAEPDRPGLIAGTFALVSAAASGVRNLAGSAVARLRKPPTPIDLRRFGDALTQVERTAGIADKLLLAPGPAGPLSGSPGIPKRAVWCDPFPLPPIKHLGRQTGTTVNDILVGAVAGALGRYVRDHGGEPGDLPTMVPVNVRPADDQPPRELGNEFALVLFHYPAGIEAPLERIIETHRRMQVIKDSPEVMLTFSMIWAIGRTGKEIERFAVDFFSNKAIGVTTNVPGPRTPRYLAGTKIRGVLAWVPGAGDQTLGVSIYSYDDRVWVGYKADATVIPDPEHLVKTFNEEIAELIALSEAI